MALISTVKTSHVSEVYFIPPAYKLKCLIVIVSRHAWPYNKDMSPKQPITLHEAPSFTELHHWFTHVFHAGKSTVM